ncbi:FGGY family carbohydrate kinase [Candidatus Arthromitus sp. SFB-rat-Yit]|uniref:FGGY family carbohydrate kinase n=1 Tax=Candidatus Arthromitus sp. SFB-rat-Yit TaxID=1041504 RepID=UPI000227A45E|nr:FGGY family carbohydrate kinase [Candidatus Arthromitus sp. SFB-rat-Yit]BAK80929.1 rhamnulokinase [Candidatus Arthromitus sp. SFB-rat-Yit]
MDCCLVIDISKINLKIMCIMLKNDRIFMQEVHRCSKITSNIFNSMKYLNVDKIIKEINEALVSVKQIGYNVESISINSSINEPIILDENNNLVMEIYLGLNMKSIYLNKIVNELGSAYIYRKTGVELNSNDTLCRLLMCKDMHKNEFKNIRKIVYLSDYIAYRLTGNLFNERSQLGFSQLFNFKNQKIDSDMIDYIGFDNDLEFNIVDYGKSIGNCKVNGVDVISPYGNTLLSSFFTTHILNKNSIFIINSYEGIIGCTEDFSKMYLEGSKFGLNHQLFNSDLVKIFRYIPCYKLVDDFLKNIENNFMIENLWNILDSDEDINYIIDFDSDIFKNSALLMNIVKYYFDFKLNGMPNSISDFIRIVYNSFAVYYKKCIKDFEKITGGIFDSICMVGDYSLNSSYNQFISDITLKDLKIGPKDSGIIGNAINQFLSTGKIKNVYDVDYLLENSFNYSQIKYSGKKIDYQYLENIV